jgi:hypothetical protein
MSEKEGNIIPFAMDCHCSQSKIALKTMTFGCFLEKYQDS